MTPNDIDRLRKLANEAQECKFYVPPESTPQEKADAAFVDAASPSVVLELIARIEELEDKVGGLEADLESAVQVAFDRGADEWARLNYPNYLWVWRRTPTKGDWQ